MTACEWAPRKKQQLDVTSNNQLTFWNDWKSRGLLLKTESQDNSSSTDNNSEQEAKPMSESNSTRCSVFVCLFVFMFVSLFLCFFACSWLSVFACLSLSLSLCDGLMTLTQWRPESTARRMASRPGCRGQPQPPQRHQQGSLASEKSSNSSRKKKKKT